ncbi:MAG: hypothetical protein RIQ89_1690 [Bacteroidota bacterium]|jgi:ABC-2 type transport system ATP-binding protein
MQEIIKVENLTKRYGSSVAVDGINFSVFKNEIFGLLGPNGAGKTTTLEIIETLRAKSSGTITVAGHDVDQAPNQVKSKIGVQLQAAGYYPSLTLRELIALFAGLYNVKVDHHHVLQSVDLLDKANSKFKELSGGQKQRFSICTTLINKPEIIFLDEPTTGLDPQARRSLWDLIKQIRNRGTTIILTTHYMDEAEYLCDRVAIMDEGKIITIASPIVLIDQLIASGFERTVEAKKATLEDVFLSLTGKAIRDL